MAAVVLEYSDVVVAQMYGHTHDDEFELLSGGSPAAPVCPIFLAPSVTSVGDHNPSYRIYYLDPTSWQVLDYEQFIMNVTDANDAGNDTLPSWVLEYSAQEAYSLSDLSASS